MLLEFLSAVLGLFSDTLDAAWSVPILQFFAVALLMYVVAGIFAFLVRRGRGGGL